MRRVEGGTKVVSMGDWENMGALTVIGKFRRGKGLRRKINVFCV